MPGECDDEMASTPVISAASSLIGHHLADRAPSGPGAGPGPGSSAAGSPLSGGGGAMMRSQSAAKDLFVAQADAVMAHAQVQSLQSALRKVGPRRQPVAAGAPAVPPLGCRTV